MHIMIDLETMSSLNNAAIASIGAVAFDPSVVYPSRDSILKSFRFYRNIDLTEQSKRSFTGNTIYWWLDQSSAARRALNDPAPIKPLNALMEFQAWYRDVGGAESWSYGATFDHVIWQDLNNEHGYKNPIHYRNQLCMRTMIKISNVECPETDAGTAHNALDDAIRQTIWIQNCFRKLSLYQDRV